jgi:hypothetical protein
MSTYFFADKAVTLLLLSGPLWVSSPSIGGLIGHKQQLSCIWSQLLQRRYTPVSHCWDQTSFNTHFAHKPLVLGLWVLAAVAAAA